MTITIQDFGGVHNGSLEQTRARLIRGGTYKRQRVIVVIPAIRPIAPKVYLSHTNLIFPPNNSVVRLLAEGMEVGDAYSTAIQNILAYPALSEFEYLLTIEADNCPPSDGVLKLIESMESHPELSAIGGLYHTKGEGGVPQVWGDPRDPVTNFRPQPPVPEQLVECCGLGMGFTIFRLAMFKDEKLRKPWFKTIAGSDGAATQDLYFWGDARKYGYRCGVDCRVRVGHWDEQSEIMW